MGTKSLAVTLSCFFINICNFSIIVWLFSTHRVIVYTPSLVVSISYASAETIAILTRSNTKDDALTCLVSKGCICNNYYRDHLGMFHFFDNCIPLLSNDCSH